MKPKKKTPSKTKTSRPLFPALQPARSNAPYLHVVRPAPRPSVVVDLERGEKVNWPWSRDETWAMYDRDARIRFGVIQGMWIASWAHAQRCGLVIERGCLTPSARFDPPEALFTALGCSMGSVIGVMGVAVPLRRDGGEKVFGAGWPNTIGDYPGVGKWGSN